MVPDERPHLPGPEAGWEESWTFDLLARDDGLGGFVRLGLRGGRATFQAALVRPGRPLVVVVDEDLLPPRGRTLEVRGEGLWTALELESPLEHWTVGMEAFGVALDDPAEVRLGCRGDRTALGTDLEWETTGPLVETVAGYALPCLVTGELLVGSETLAIEADGWRSHEWGPGAERWEGPPPDGALLAAVPLLVRSPTAERRLWPSGWTESA